MSYYLEAADHLFHNALFFITDFVFSTFQLAGSVLKFSEE